MAVTRFAPLFLVSLTAVGMETALTRYFAVASWSDYGYWIISIVMMGFAFSGVVLALTQDALARRGEKLFAALPAGLILSGALGYAGCIVNPFNPLQLQNQVTYLPQLANIALYYAALLPFFFLAGLFISLCFVATPGRLGLVYAADLAGAGAGCIAVLALMFFIPPFLLVPALLPALAAAAWFTEQKHRNQAGTAALLALLGAETLLALGPQAAISPYKPLYAPLHTPGAHVLARVLSPRGDYLLLDDFTERVNTDISNDSAMLGYPDPPRGFGLYRDGIRIASLPSNTLTAGYAPGALDALPYALLRKPNVLLAGASGGFRITESLALGAARVTALEPEPVLFAALTHGLGPSPAFGADPRVQITPASPVSAARQNQKYGLIDISADFMDAAPANVNAFTVQALAAYLAALNPGGILSIPVSIEDFPAYALRMLATAGAALAADGIADPDAHIVVYRSAWNARLLVSLTPFTPTQITAIANWCNDRSFDVSYYAGINPAALRDNLYNDLPAVSFDAGTVTSTGPDDSIADEAQAVLHGQPSVSAQAFNLRPATDDRPAFYAILRLSNPRLLLARLQILPQAEIGALVNLAVLAQALVVAALVLCVPLAAPKPRGGAAVGVLRPALYFPALALGFLFIEIYGIEKASLLLDDRTAGFAVVLSAMLLFSGLGSFLSTRFEAAPERGIWLAGLVVALWATAMLAFLPSLLAAAVGLPYLARAILAAAVIAPVAVAMGLPFPLGLSRLQNSAFLPWAWGLNGAVSVVATPLANLIARNIGFHAVLAGAVLMYGLAVISFPRLRRQPAWRGVQTHSPVAD